MLKGTGKVWKAARNSVAQVVYVPADIVKDSQWPFKRKEKVNVTLDPKNQRLIITKVVK